MSQDAGPRDPTFHMYNCSTFSESAMRVISDVIDLNTYMIATPARIMVVGVIRLCLEIRTMANVGIMASTMAFRVTARLWSPTGISGSPRMNIRAAPKDAPDATPVVYGSASGLRSSDCITTPATARGTPSSHTTVSATWLSVDPPFRWALRTSMTMSGVTVSIICDRNIEPKAITTDTRRMTTEIRTFLRLSR